VYPRVGSKHGKVTVEKSEKVTVEKSEKVTVGRAVVVKCLSLLGYSLLLPEIKKKPVSRLFPEPQFGSVKPQYRAM